MRKSKFHRRLILWLPIGAVHVVVLWAVAHSILTSRAEQFTARQQVFDPRELWSIEVVPGQAGWLPVKLCTDGRVRSGFTTPLPSVGGAPCLPTSPPQQNGNRLSIRCEVNGSPYMASAVVEGDTAADFTTAYRVTGLGGTWEKPEVYEQTRRYRRLGVCPDGWAVGDHTDHTGVRASGDAVRQVDPPPQS